MKNHFKYQLVRIIIVVIILLLVPSAGAKAEGVKKKIKSNSVVYVGESCWIEGTYNPDSKYSFEVNKKGYISNPTVEVSKPFKIRYSFSPLKQGEVKITIKRKR